MTSPATADQRPEPADGDASQPTRIWSRPSAPVTPARTAPSTVRHAGGARRLAVQPGAATAPTPTTWSPRRSPRCSPRCAPGAARRGRSGRTSTRPSSTLRYDRLRPDRRVEFTDDLSRYEAGVPFADPTVDRLERAYAARAFARLPERWRAVLWHTAVRGRVAGRGGRAGSGLTPGGVAALAFRARERLRQIYLQEHVTAGRRRRPAGGPPTGWPGTSAGGSAGRARSHGRRSPGRLCADCRAALASWRISRLPADVTAASVGHPVPAPPVRITVWLHVSERRERGVRTDGSLGPCPPPLPTTNRLLRPPHSPGVISRLRDRFGHLVQELGKFGTVGGIAFLVDLADLQPAVSGAGHRDAGRQDDLHGDRGHARVHRQPVLDLAAPRAPRPAPRIPLYFVFNAVGLGIGLACLGISHYGLGNIWPAVFQTPAGRQHLRPVHRHRVRHTLPLLVLSPVRVHRRGGTITNTVRVGHRDQG